MRVLEYLVWSEVPIAALTSLPRAGQPSGRARHLGLRLGGVVLHGDDELYVGDEYLALSMARRPPFNRRYQPTR